MIHLGTGPHTGAAHPPRCRAGAFRLRAGAIGLAMGMSVPAPADAQQRRAADAPAGAPVQRAIPGDESIRPFQVNVPDSALADLRRRSAATRWPDRETVGDQTQGVPLARIRPLVEYWGTGYDWRKAGARLNALPQSMTTIDGLDIHFIHVRSRPPDALPLIMTHGWPGSVFELLKTIGPLTDPTAAHGGRLTRG